LFKLKTIWLVTFIAGSFAATAHAQISHQMQALKVLDTGTSVLVEKISVSATKYGLSEDKVKTMIELKLLQNGLKVLTPNDVSKSPFSPTVYVQIGAIDHDDRGLSYSVHVAVLAEAIVEQDVVGLILAPTKSAIDQFLSESIEVHIWDKGMIGTAGPSRLPEAVYSDVNEKVDALLRDYLLVRQSIMQTK
jgi:hypothetical protein